MSKENDPIKFWQDKLKKRWLVLTIQMNDVEEALNNLLSYYELKIKDLERKLSTVQEPPKEVSQ